MCWKHIGLDERKYNGDYEDYFPGNDWQQLGDLGSSKLIARSLAYSNQEVSFSLIHGVSLNRPLQLALMEEDGSGSTLLTDVSAKSCAPAYPLQVPTRRTQS